MAEFKSNVAGSSAQNEPAYVLIGKLQKSHGTKGEIAMRVVTQFPERIHTGKSVYLGLYTTSKEAATVYDRAAVLLHGEFARTNNDLYKEAVAL